MIQFKPVTKQDAGKLRKYYQDCQYGGATISILPGRRAPDVW